MVCQSIQVESKYNSKPLEMIWVSFFTGESLLKLGLLVMI